MTSKHSSSGLILSANKLLNGDYRLMKGDKENLLHAEWSDENSHMNDDRFTEKCRSNQVKKSNKITSKCVYVVVGLVILLKLLVITAVVLAVLWKLGVLSSKPGYNTALIYEPNLGDANNLIKFKQATPEQYRPYTDRLRKILTEYQPENQVGDEFIDCTSMKPGDRPPDKVCRFDLADLGDDCIKEKEFGYDEGQPCVLLKLDMIKDWRPVPYNSTVRPPPEAISAGLGQRWRNDTIGVTCRGELPADQENMGPLRFWPEHGWPAVYFPYTGQGAFLPPLVAVRFDHPKNDVVMQVICEAWAQNINNSHSNTATAKFLIIIDY